MNFWHHMPRPVIGLAPMDGVTDIAFRHIVPTYGGPDVVFTEFTNVHDICHGRQMGWKPLRFTGCQRPIVAQLYGKHPDLFYQAAHVDCRMSFANVLETSIVVESRAGTAAGHALMYSWKG